MEYFVTPANRLIENALNSILLEIDEEEYEYCLLIRHLLDYCNIK
jgi:hypothetical protein